MGETVEEILRIVRNMEQAADKPVLPMALFEADRESAIARIMQLDEELEGS
jgi:hypothetical protein